ncbi:MAG: hypothetical protein QM770_15930 [Tepidisphaeraceae bacterium]
MKIRLSTNQIRVRVRRSEVAQLADNRSLEFSLALPGAVTLNVVVQPQSANGVTMSSSARLTIGIAHDELAAWANDEARVGLSFALPDAPTQVLIEKDFACLHGDASDNADTFDHPAANGARA